MKDKKSIALKRLLHRIKIKEKDYESHTDNYGTHMSDADWHELNGYLKACQTIKEWINKEMERI